MQVLCILLQIFLCTNLNIPWNLYIRTLCPYEDVYKCVFVCDSRMHIRKWRTAHIHVGLDVHIHSHPWLQRYVVPSKYPHSVIVMSLCTTLCF